jgi:hypothetical protein
MANVLGEIIATSQDVQKAIDNLAATQDSAASDSNTPGAGLFDSIGSYFQSGVQALQGIADSNVVQQITGLINQGNAPVPAAAPVSTSARISAALKSGGSNVLIFGLAAIAILLLILRK